MSLLDWGQALDDAIAKVDYKQLAAVGLVSVDGFKQALNDIKENLDADHELLLEDQDLFFGEFVETEPGENGAKLAALFEKWRDGERPPSLTSILMFAADGLDIPADSPAFQAGLMASVSGEIALDNGYHDNHHFREVTASMLRLLVTNNELAMQGQLNAPLLDTENLAKSLLAAIAHDQNHDGTSNVFEDDHIPFRLEQLSINTVQPFEEMAGMSEDDIKDVQTMIYVTDVSAEKGGVSPHTQMKEIIHKASLKDGVQPEDYKPELARLAEGDDLRQMAAMLSDADLTPSAGTDYEFNQRMTFNLNMEAPFIKPGPDTTKFFCGVVVGGEFTSTAGRVQSNSALAKKVEHAERLIYARENGLDNNDPAAKLENNV